MKTSSLEPSPSPIIGHVPKLNGSPAPALSTSGAVPLTPASSCNTAFGCPRDFLDNRFVYTVISPRARGLSVGINMNPDRHCNFDCIYCEVDRSQSAREAALDVPVMIAELSRTLELVESGRLGALERYRTTPPDLLQLRHIALSGDGEPTLCPNFVDAVEGLAHFRASGHRPFLKMVLITNGSFLDRLEVVEGLRLFTVRDEIWAKLDVGTQEAMNRLNRSDCPIEKVLANILMVGRERPIVIQSLFPSLRGQPPASGEIDDYVRRLRDLKDAGAQISLVQIYSATRPTPNSGCGHLPLRTLSDIAQRVRETCGLKAEVF